MRITVEIPDEVARQIAELGNDPARLLLENFAAESYRAGKMTMEQIRQLLGFGTRMQVDAFLQQHQVYDYNIQELEKDLATLERLEQTRTKAQ